MSLWNTHAWRYWRERNTQREPVWGSGNGWSLASPFQKCPHLKLRKLLVVSVSSIGTESEFFSLLNLQFLPHRKNCEWKMGELLKHTGENTDGVLAGWAQRQGRCIWLQRHLRHSNVSQANCLEHSPLSSFRRMELFDSAFPRHSYWKEKVIIVLFRIDMDKLKVKVFFAIEINKSTEEVDYVFKL